MEKFKRFIWPVLTIVSLMLNLVAIVAWREVSNKADTAKNISSYAVGLAEDAHYDAFILQGKVADIEKEINY